MQRRRWDDADHDAGARNAPQDQKRSTRLNKHTSPHKSRYAPNAEKATSNNTATFNLSVHSG
jgi:hypothetical protein